MTFNLFKVASVNIEFFSKSHRTSIAETDVTKEDKPKG